MDEEMISNRRRSLNTGALQAFLESIRSYSDGFIFARPGQSLYHYTDLAGLSGIVGKHDLWLTHLRYSNDNEELTHGCRIAEEVVDQQIDSAPRNSIRRRVLKRVKDLLKGTAGSAVYITCFCKADNLLGQWRGYGANGTGVSIAIDPFGFTEIAGHEQVGLVRLWKVFYETERQKEIVHEAINHTLRAGGDEEALAWELFDKIQFFIPTFKNPDFQDEQEYRLIFTPQPDSPVPTQFRVGRGMLIPYISLTDILRAVAVSIPRLPIQRVRIGPSSNRDLNAVSARLLLNQSGYEDVGIEVSNTPYRG